MSKITDMIAHHQTLLATRRETARIAFEADEAHRANEQALVAAMVEASGRKLGDEIKTKDGRIGRISAFRLDTEGTGLVARCQGQNKEGKWSTSSRLDFLCAIALPKEG